MPFRTIPGETTRYGLIAYSRDGAERGDDPDGLMSQRLIESACDGISDLFVFSHGWMGDVPAALRQYDRWIHAFDASAADRRRADQAIPGFRPLFIGLHWPSLPWGDEELQDGAFSAESAPPFEVLLRTYLDRLGDSSGVSCALSAILEEARRGGADHLSESARQAFLDLDGALGFAAEGPGGAPDADREPFDPEAAFEAYGASFGVGEVFSGLLGMLRVFSYWSMKNRARKIGEGGVHDFIVALQHATASRKTRIHLMGHSFGCIVTSSMLKGSGEGAPLDRPVDSVVLAQGALSLWSYASTIPFQSCGPGYFHHTIQEGRIGGPLVTTQSRFDAAVGRFYPLASQVSGEAAFDPVELPKYGAVGAFGLQGLAKGVQANMPMLAADGEYDFRQGRIYNLEGSRFIRRCEGSSGAHNDIAGPEVAHAVWQAALTLF